MGFLAVDAAKEEAWRSWNRICSAEGVVLLGMRYATCWWIGLS